MTLERDFRGTLETRGGADINGTPDGLDSLIIGRDLTGTIKSQENISAKIVVRRDMSGAIVANEDGDSAQTGQGSIVRDILIMRNFTGSIKALTRSGAGGRFDGHIDVGGDFVGSQNAAALIQAQGGIGPKSCVQLNYDGALPGTWNSTYASVVLGPTTYRSGNESAGVRYIDHRGGIEMDFNGSAGDFSIDPLTGCFVERHTADDESTHQNTAPPVLPAHK